MDASQYKDYVLVLLFVKYVSDKAQSRKDYLLQVPAGGGFADMVALKSDKEIGEKMNQIIAKLAGANDLKGVIDVADWNDPDKLGKGKEMVDRLSNLVGIFDTPALDFRGNRAEGDDLLGDARARADSPARAPARRAFPGVHGPAPAAVGGDPSGAQRGPARGNQGTRRLDLSW